MGVCNHTTSLCRATTKRLGPVALDPSVFVHGRTLDWGNSNLQLGSSGGNWLEVQKTDRWFLWPHGLMRGAETDAAQCGLLFLPGFGPDASVLEGDHAFREGLVLEQRKLTLRKTGREKRKAFADEDWNDADIELIDEVLFEEVAHELAAAHQPDVFSGALAQLLDESFRSFIDESYAAALAGPLGMGENVGPQTRVVVGTSAHFESDIVRLAAHERGINGGEKWTHRIVLGHEEKID